MTSSEAPDFREHRIRMTTEILWVHVIAREFLIHNDRAYWEAGVGTDRLGGVSWRARQSGIMATRHPQAPRSCCATATQVPRASGRDAALGVTKWQVSAQRIRPSRPPNRHDADAGRSVRSGCYFGGLSLRVVGLRPAAQGVRADGAHNTTKASPTCRTVPSLAHFTGRPHRCENWSRG
jgi:hypothetical protein